MTKSFGEDLRNTVYNLAQTPLVTSSGINASKYETPAASGRACLSRTRVMAHPDQLGSQKDFRLVFVPQPRFSNGHFHTQVVISQDFSGGIIGYSAPRNIARRQCRLAKRCEIGTSRSPSYVHRTLCQPF